jgi:hypothetical protein
MLMFVNDKKNFHKIIFENSLYILVFTFQILCNI